MNSDDNHLHDAGPRGQERTFRFRANRSARTQRAVALAGFLALAVTAALVACSPAASNAPSIALPSVDVSAAASLGTQAALTALDQVDVAITANESSGDLSAENATSLKTLAASIRTSLQTGDVTAARAGFEQFSTQFDQFAAELKGDAGTQLQDAVAALEAALAGG